MPIVGHTSNGILYTTACISGLGENRVTQRRAMLMIYTAEVVSVTDSVQTARPPFSLGQNIIAVCIWNY